MKCQHYENGLSITFDSAEQKQRFQEQVYQLFRRKTQEKMVEDLLNRMRSVADMKDFNFRVNQKYGKQVYADKPTE